MASSPRGIFTLPLVSSTAKPSPVSFSENAGAGIFYMGCRLPAIGDTNPSFFIKSNTSIYASPYFCILFSWLYSSGSRIGVIEDLFILCAHRKTDDMHLHEYKIHSFIGFFGGLDIERIQFRKLLFEKNLPYFPTGFWHSLSMSNRTSLFRENFSFQPVSSFLRCFDDIP